MSALRRTWLLSAGLVLSMSSVVLAETPAAEAPSDAEKVDFLKADTAPSFPIVRALLTLGLVMGGLYAAKPLIKKSKWGSLGGSEGAGLEIVAKTYLGPRTGLCLVRARGAHYLVGIGADGVRLIADLNGDVQEKQQANNA